MQKSGATLIDLTTHIPNHFASSAGGGGCKDFEMYKPFARVGGLIAFHDIVDNQPLETNQVQHFWNKIKDSYEHYELINNPDQCSYEIGVIRA